MSYDTWKTTDPADRDPYRDNDCPSCGAPDGYRCAPECDCETCERAWEAEEQRNDPHERAAARARNNDFEDTGGKDWT